MLRWKVLSARGFYRDLAAMAVAGAAAMVPCTWLAELLAARPELAAIACGIAGTLTVFAGLKAVRPELKLLQGATASVMAGAALGWLFPLSPVAACLAFGGCFGLAQASGSSTWGAKGALVAASAATALIGGAVLGHLPLFSLVPQPIAFALFGAYMGLGSLPAHLRVRRDLVGERYEALPPSLSPGCRDVALRTYALYDRFQKALVAGEVISERQEEEASAHLDALALRVLSLTARWHQLDALLAESGDVDSRVKQLEAQMASASDDHARAAYTATRTALVARTGELAELHKERERVASTAGLYYTKLEDLYTGFVRRTDVAQITSELASTVAALPAAT